MYVGHFSSRHLSVEWTTNVFWFICIVGVKKFKFFVGCLIANKHLPITDNCQKLKQKRYRKSKTNQYTLGKQKETKLKRKTKTKNKRRKKKQKEIICHQIASSLNDLSLDWLIQKNDDVMILIYDQQEEYYANLPIINGIRKH